MVYCIPKEEENIMFVVMCVSSIARCCLNIIIIIPLSITKAFVSNSCHFIT